MKKLLLLLVAIVWLWIVLFWVKSWFFGKEDILVEEKEIVKQEFFVEATSYSDLDNHSSIQKTWKVNSSQDITLSANASGRVSYISVKPGEQIVVGQVLAQLEDNIWNYAINISKASNGVERSKINYDSQKISLDKAVFDAELNLERLERNLETLKKDSEQSLIQAKDNLNNNINSGIDSTSALRLQQLDNNIEKAKLDYEIRLTSDAETIESYKVSFKNNYNTLLIFLDDVIQFTDTILSVTEVNKRTNRDFDQFLWAKDRGQKTLSEQRLLQLIAYRDSDTFTLIDSDLQSGNISEERALEAIEDVNTWYELAKVLLNSLELTLNNSLVSQGSLGDAEIASYQASINWYQAQLQGNYASFISFWSTVKNDNMSNLEDQILTARNNLSNAQQSRAVTLRSLNNGIKEAQINYTSSAKEYNKLTISSPINGTVWASFIDAWQEVLSGTQLFDLVSDKSPEVEVSFSSKEKALVKVGQEVFVDIWTERITGSIYSVSEVADDNLNHKATIVFRSSAWIIGNFVSVEVPIHTKKVLVPINIIKTQWDNIGLVKTLSGSTFEDVRVRMWEMFWEYVEIVSCAKNCEDLNIIMNDTSNFDANKFIIVEK